MTDRMKKIDELVKRIVAKEMIALFPEDIVSVTEAQVSKDLAYAKIWVSVLGDPEDALKRYNESAVAISRTLAGSLQTRKSPRVTFVSDTRAQYADRIDALINEMHQENKDK